MRRSISAVFIVIAAVQEGSGQQREDFGSKKDELAERVQYGLKWYRHWDHSRLENSKRDVDVRSAEAFLLPGRWVVFIPQVAMAISIAATSGGDSIGPILEIDEADGYSGGPELALKYYLGFHGPNNNDGCLGPSVHAASGDAKATEASASMRLPVTRPCTESKPWNVIRRRQVGLSTVAEIPPRTMRSADLEKVAGICREWATVSFPGLRGVFAVPSVDVDVDPRIYVLVKIREEFGIVMLGRAESGGLSVQKYLDRAESVRRYRQIVEASYPFEVPWGF